MFDNRPLENLLAIVAAMGIGAILLASVQKYGEVKANAAKRDAAALGAQNGHQ